MEKTKTKLPTTSLRKHPLLAKNKRALTWRKMKGLWKNRQPNPISELNKMRQEWN